MTSGQIQLLGIILSALTVIFIPLMVMLYRGIVKWTRTEDKLNELIVDMKSLIDEKDTTHREIASVIERTAKALDIRLRWLEEHKWR